MLSGTISQGDGGLPQIHSAICVTDDHDGVAARLRGIVGTDALSWEPHSPALISAILGPESSGTIEVVRVPGELRGRLSPGTLAMSFAVDDLEARVAACRLAGLDVSVTPEIPGGLSCAVVAVSGLEFELVATG